MSPTHNKVDASLEKHVPVVIKENGKIRVEVGSTLHPMLPEHYIEWIALVAEYPNMLPFFLNKIYT